MGSLPKAKAGVGSAVNDTTRELGGALGVAIIGSVLSSLYAARLGDNLDGTCRAPALDAAKESMGAALAVGNQVGGSDGARIVDAARDAFVHAMTRASLVTAAFAVLGAVVALRWLPARAIDHDDAAALEAIDVEGVSVIGDARASGLTVRSRATRTALRGERSGSPRSRDPRRIEIVDRLAPHQPHRVVDLVSQQRQHCVDTALAVRPQRVDIGSTDHHRPCAERERPQHVTAPPHATVEKNLEPVPHCGDDLGKRSQRCRRAVELAATMIRHDDTVGAVIERAREHLPRSTSP